MKKLIFFFILLISSIKAMDSTKSSDDFYSSEEREHSTKRKGIFSLNSKNLNADFWVKNSDKLQNGNYAALEINNCQIINENFAFGVELSFPHVIVKNSNLDLEGLKLILGTTRWETLQTIELFNTSIKADDPAFKKLLQEVIDEGGPDIIVK